MPQHVTASAHLHQGPAVGPTPLFQLRNDAAPATPLPAGTSVKAALAKLPTNDFRVETLPNGARIVIREVPGADMVNLKIGSMAGANQDLPGNEGAAHLIEHLAFQGSDKRSGSSIRQDLDRMGRMANAYTNATETVFMADVPARDAHKAARLLGDMYAEPSSDRYKVAQETRIVQHEMRTRLGNRGVQAGLELSEMVPDGSDFRKIVGTPTSVDAVTPGYVKKWTDAYYSGVNTVVYVEGDPKSLPLKEIRAKVGALPTGVPALDPSQLAQLKQLISKMLPASERAKMPDALKNAEVSKATATEQQPASVKLVPNTAIASTDLTLAFPIPAGVTTTQAQLVTTALNKRLYRNVRERGQLTYTPQAWVADGSIVVTADVHPDEVRDAMKTIAQTIKGTPRTMTKDAVADLRRQQASRVIAQYSEPGAFAQQAFAAELAAPGLSKSVGKSAEGMVNQIHGTSTADARAAARSILDMSQVRVLASGQVRGTDEIQSGLDDAKSGVTLSRVPFQRSRYAELTKTPTGPLKP